MSVFKIKGKLISLFLCCLLFSPASYAGGEHDRAIKNSNDSKELRKKGPVTDNELLGSQLISSAVNAKELNEKEISNILNNIHAIYDAIGLNKNNLINDFIMNPVIINEPDIYTHQINKVIYSDIPLELSIVENSIIISPAVIKIAHSANNIIISHSDIKISHSYQSTIAASGDVKISFDGGNDSTGSVVISNGVTRVSNAVDSVIYSTKGIEISNSKNVKTYNAEYVKSRKDNLEKLMTIKLF